MPLYLYLEAYILDRCRDVFVPLCILLKLLILSQTLNSPTVTIESHDPQPKKNDFHFISRRQQKHQDIDKRR